MGNEKSTAGVEGIAAGEPPGAEQGGEGHLGGGAFGRTGSTADLASRNQMAEGALGEVVVRWHGGVDDEGEESPEGLLNPPTEWSLGGRPVFQEWGADRHQPVSEGGEDRAPFPHGGNGSRSGIIEDLSHRSSPPTEPDILRPLLGQRVDVA